MIVLDTNIVSTFVRVSAMDLLQRMFANRRFSITPSTLAELDQAIQVGCSFLVPTVAAVRNGTGIELLQLQPVEVAIVQSLGMLGAGEAESIAVCSHRTSVTFVTNDKEARAYCRRRNLSCIDLFGLLRALWLKGICSQPEVEDLVLRIEAAEGLVFKKKHLLFR